MVTRRSGAPAQAGLAALGSVCLLAIAGCGLGSARVTIGVDSPSPARSTAPANSDPLMLPLSRAVAQRLPGGVFYVLAGPNPGSFNLWEVTDNGNEVQLTRNKIGYGISAFGASEAGVVMADAASGLDELAKLTSHGPVLLPEGRGSGPDISDSGRVSFITPAYDKAHPYFDLRVMRSLSAPARVAYQQRAALSATWGPKDAIAAVSGGHPPGTKGPDPRLLIITGHQIRILKTPLANTLSNVTWTEQAPGLALSSWQDKGDVLMPGGSAVSLPDGWLPGAWSPSGKQLLVLGFGRKFGPNGSLGLWTLAQPHRVHIIGELPVNVAVGKFVWLARPART